MIIPRLNAKTAQTFAVAAFVSAAAVTLSGCGDDVPDYSRFTALPADRWVPAEFVEFEPWPLDSTLAASRSYDLRVCLRYRMPAQERVALVVEQEAPGLGTIAADTLILHLIGHGGRPAGRGDRGVYSIEKTLRHGLRLTEGYSVAIHPADTLVSATDIGISLFPSKP